MVNIGEEFFDQQISNPVKDIFTHENNVCAEKTTPEGDQSCPAISKVEPNEQ